MTEHDHDRPAFPFSAVVGQSRYKLALKLALVDPGIGGLLVTGPRGTAKSTLARALPAITPAQSRLVNLPLGATEEMLVGTLDLQQVLGEQKVEFSPGMLARAHHGVLYVDEINLLPDNLVDILLDVAAGGTNYVERDGISHSHPASFVLLGTMNPDEGELRPQLLDRFGLSVAMQDRFSAEERVAIVRLREEFDRDADGLLARHETEQNRLREQLARATERLTSVYCSDALRHHIAERCIDAGVDGLRADIVWTRAASAHAALEGRDAVTEEDVEAVADLVLAHRRQDNDQAPSQNQAPPAGPRGSHQPGEASGQGDRGSMASIHQATSPHSRFQVPHLHRTDAARGSASIYQRSKGPNGHGSAETPAASRRINWFGTLARSLGQWPPGQLCFRPQRGSDAVMHLILLDTSASMLRGNRLGDAKAAIVEIARQAYLDRAQIGIIGFGNQQVSTLLPRRRAPRALRRLLDSIEGGGGTPLEQVVQQARQFHQQLSRLQPGLRLRNYLFTDGRSRANLSGMALPGETVLVDMESTPVKRGRGRELSMQLEANYLALA